MKGISWNFFKDIDFTCWLKVYILFPVIVRSFESFFVKDITNVYNN